MKLWFTRIAGFAAVLFVIVAPAVAHHAKSGYDVSRTITLKATVTKVEFTNPHALLLFDVTDDSGQVKNWHAITGGPERLSHYGWTSDTLKPGDSIIITGNPTKSGSPEMWLTKIVLPDGREVDMHR